MAINWTFRFNKIINELSKLEEIKKFAKKLLKELTNKEIKIEELEVKIEDLEKEKKDLKKMGQSFF